MGDLCISSRSKYMRTAERQQQQCIRKITHWAKKNGFRISKSNTRCVHWCQQRKMHSDPLIKLVHTKIPVVDKYRFLAVIFTRKLAFILDLKYLKSKCTRAQQLLQVVAHTEWGADRQTLLKRYISLINSKLDYAIFIYRSTRWSYVKQLDPVLHEGLR